MVHSPWKLLASLSAGAAGIARHAAILVLALLAACGPEPTPTAQPTATVAPVAPSPTTAAPAATATPVAVAPSPTTAAPSASPTAAAPAGPAEGEFQNPIFRNDFADPFVIEAEGTFYAYATNASGRNIQLATSTDLITWQLRRDALPALPRWARLGGSLVWAPEVIRAGDKYVLYYTARDKASDKQCVGVAVADKPDGPFRDANDAPFICQAQEGGTIDASPFRDGDKLYIYYKNDGNCCGIATYLYGQELSPDGLSLLGEPVRLVRNDAAWEGNLVEAPTMWNRDGRYYLFFSANSYAGMQYAVGYATCEGPLGPCQDAPENPILSSKMKEQPLVIGPGHQTMLRLGGEDWMVYHVWEMAGGLRGSRRFMWLDRVEWQDGKPIVQGPTTAPQARPELSADVFPSGDITATAAISPMAPVDAAPTATAAPAISPTVGSSTGSGETFSNPVIDRNFPDPDLLKVDNTYYAFATNDEDAGVNIQAARSRDLVNWELLEDALPGLPDWAGEGFTWAPEVSRAPGGQGYVMYFTARHTESEQQCIGAATAQSPEGPYEPAAGDPFICALDQGGSIDASTFEDNGKHYVLWKNDGNCCGLPVRIYLQEVSSDGLRAEGTARPLLGIDQYWEGNVIEAPTMWKHEGKYYLLYSANDYGGANYAIGYAVADSIEGPYAKPDQPLLASVLGSSSPVIGPGGQDVVVDDDGEVWIVYHTWDPSVSYRNMNLDELVWENGAPVVRGPDKSPQPVP